MNLVCPPPKLARLKEIFVYFDILDTVLVGNTQAPMLGYLPIQTKWGDQTGILTHLIMLK